MASFRKGSKVRCNVGRCRGMICTVVAIHAINKPTPGGKDATVRVYDVRTTNGNVVRRSEDKITAGGR